MRGKIFKVCLTILERYSLKGYIQNILEEHKTKMVTHKLGEGDRDEKSSPSPTCGANMSLSLAWKPSLRAVPPSVKSNESSSSMVDGCWYIVSK